MSVARAWKLVLVEWVVVILLFHLYLTGIFMSGLHWESYWSKAIKANCPTGWIFVFGMICPLFLIPLATYMAHILTKAVRKRDSDRLRSWTSLRFHIFTIALVGLLFKPLLYHIIGLQRDMFYPFLDLGLIAYTGITLKIVYDFGREIAGITPASVV